MASTSAARPTMSTSRHHPYAQPSQQASQRPNTKYPARPTMPDEVLPPSPPRSRRDASETPPLGLGVAFGGATGGKWWDEELPAPPASLSSILDSFRRSGEGDRDLLLSILGAKKAEEERLTALIQTRLTIIQARLSLHQAQANLDASSTPSSAGPMQLPVPTPQPQLLSPNPPPAGLYPHGARRASPSTYPAEGSRPRMDKTPSLESRGSNSEASSQGAVSPRDEVPPPFVSTITDKKAEMDRDRYAYSHPSGGQFWGRRENALPPIRTMKEGPGPVRNRGPGSAGSRGSLSPRSNGERNGLDMLLDAGRQV